MRSGTNLAVAVVLLTAWGALTVGSLHPRPPAPPRSVDLRPEFERFGLKVRAQGARGSCSVFTVTAALEFALAKRTGRGEPLSVEFLNWACCKLIDDHRDRGQFFSDLERAYETSGICRERELPYRRRYDPTLEPSPAALASAAELRKLRFRFHWLNPLPKKMGISEALLEEVKATLRCGWPVCGGSGHSVLLVGYEDDPTQPGGGVVFTRDSGSARWGVMTYADTLRTRADLLWIDLPPRGS
jgi:hypothetical protein